MIFQGLFIDGFAGGGGASTGVGQAIGRSVDIAINHSPSAIAIHRANHPTTTHYCQDIKAVWPKAATKMQPVWGAWFSPDCKEFSKAKGGPVKDRSIRMLAWEIPVWLDEVQPLVCYIENVEEFQYAAPLDENNVPIKGLEGKEFDRWVRACRRRGYRVKWRLLRACDYGAPTSRRRLYIIMRRDKMPIVWPKPSHGRPDCAGVRSRRLLPYRTAGECIDWSIDCPSIFDRKRPLKEATLRRVAHGVMRYVVTSARPFIVPVTHSKGWSRAHDSSDPLRTITTANGGEFAVVDARLAPHITKFHGGSVGAPMDGTMPTVTSNGEPARPAGAIPLGMVAASLHKFAQNGVGKDAREPLDTAMAGATKHGVVSAFLSSMYTSNTNGGRGKPTLPLKTIMAGANHHGVVCAHMEQANTGSVGHEMRRPLSTILGKAANQRLVETTLIAEGALPPEMLERAVTVAAFLIKYYGSETGGHGLSEPIDTVTCKDRFAVVTVTIDAVTYVIVDIGLRMLKPRELARAQGFPDDYILDPIVPKMKRGKLVHERLTIAEQISAIGNSVCPPVARALVTANQPGLGDLRLAA